MFSYPSIIAQLFFFYNSFIEKFLRRFIFFRLKQRRTHETERNGQKHSDASEQGTLLGKVNNALCLNAARAGKRALGLFTISDHIYRAEELTSEQRQNSFVQMITIALDTAVKMATL